MPLPWACKGLRPTLATLMVLIFTGTNFCGFRTKSRKFVPAKCLDLSKLRKLIPTKFFFTKSDFSNFPSL